MIDCMWRQKQRAREKRRIDKVFNKLPISNNNRPSFSHSHSLFFFSLSLISYQQTRSDKSMQTMSLPEHKTFRTDSNKNIDGQILSFSVKSTNRRRRRSCTCDPEEHADISEGRD